MSKISEAVALGEQLAADDAHGYDQSSRWGPDYDCSSLITAIWQAVGVKVRSAGASNTGNMRGPYMRTGFADVTGQVDLKTGAGLRPGDVLINYDHHAAMMVSSGKLLQASINEKGTVTGGRTGDQTGREIAVRSYYNYPWNCVLRYEGDGSQEQPETSSEIPVEDPVPFLRTLQIGSKGRQVLVVQAILIALHYSCGPDGADADFGYNTRNAVMHFQNDNGLLADGVVGQKTWSILLGG